MIATADQHGVPNVTYVSQLFMVDDEHVALSRQFFNKTSRNLDQNPRAAAEVIDPVTFQAYRFRLRFLRSESAGPLFETMSVRINAIASHTGMSGVFRLVAADVFKVERIECVEGFLSVSPSTDSEVSLDGLRSELRGVQWVSQRINRARDLESLLANVLEALDAYFDFHHTMILLHDNATGRLVAMASHGYGESGVGAEVELGDGIIGTVARDRSVLRISGLHESLRYGRAVRRETQHAGAAVRPEIPLPGLPDAQSALLIPLWLDERLIGVLAAESRDAMAFGEWHEAYLEVIGNQIALGIDRMIDRALDETDDEESATVVEQSPRSRRRHVLTYYRNDDSVFVDGEYLIRNIPGRILWKLLREREREGRSDFTNRELRLDAALGLPEIKDNLESRLILLRHRLQEKCPDIRLTSTGRGRFALAVDAELELNEK